MTVRPERRPRQFPTTGCVVHTYLSAMHPGTAPPKGVKATSASHTLRLPCSTGALPGTGPKRRRDTCFCSPASDSYVTGRAAQQHRYF